MATNDFLPFATGGSANVLTQAQWAALASVSTGFQSGLADSKSVNKALRQSSIMSAVVAQFIVNQTGQNATDDGTTATLIANLLAAVRASSNAVVGSMRNAKMYVTTASASATFTADEIIVESVLGGLTYRISGFNKTINLGTTGSGGIDSGSAPVSGYVALYAIYNPTTGASALLATNATSAAVPHVYGGANMPTGFTASGLVSVWPTNASSQFIVGFQRDRRVSFPFTLALSSSSSAPASFTTLSIAALVPMNAVSIGGEVLAGSTSSANITLGVAADSAGNGQQASQAALVTVAVCNFKIDLIVAQTLYWKASVSTGTPNMSIALSSYEF
ncbi:hypothetical protein [Caballeronia sp. INDeC2]|uniref:hypothetical protein n=1 Tax=Caballeronia sp. INDeC2 TaxID=2921747 RepID=UPI002029606A|nr:hypothetical protein [Caballeronia sp. INDeC2]